MSNCHISGGAVLSSNNTLITFGTKWGGLSGANLVTLLDGLPLTDGSAVPPFVVQRPSKETGSVVRASLYGYNICVLYDTGNFYTAGLGANGVLGLGSVTDYSELQLSETNVVDYREPVELSCNPLEHRLLIKKTDGYWYGCGDNGYGQLGTGNTTNQTSFVKLTDLGTTVREIWNIGGIYGFIVAQLADGTLYYAGGNWHGQAGRGNTTSPISSFIDISSYWLTTAGDTVLNVFGGCGYYDSSANSHTHIIMLIEDSNGNRYIRGAGNNTYGPLGDTTTTQRTSPVSPSGLPAENIIKLAHSGGGPASVYALTENGRLFVWGYNATGQLGIGSISNTPTPTEVTIFGVDFINVFSNNASEAYPFRNQAFVITTRKELYAMGYNYNGELGDGTVTQRTSPVHIPFDMEKHGEIVDIKWSGRNNTTTTLLFLTDKGEVFTSGYYRGTPLSSVLSLDVSKLRKVDFGGLL